MSEEKQNKVDILNATDIPVTLTYPRPGVDPITFYLRPTLQKEDYEIRQARVALTDEQREQTAYQHNVDCLVRLCVKAPEGLVGMNGDEDFQGALRKLLEEENPNKSKIVADALVLYYSHTTAKEFFRGV